MKTRSRPPRGGGRRKGSFGDGGQMSGYGEFRYGENLTNRNGTRRPIYVPGKDKPRPILNKDRHKHMVDRTAEMLASGRTTKFENEGACRAGLRSGLCLDGHGWEVSDAAAARVVSDALHQIGARRPTWEQGQPEYAHEFVYCAWCSRPLDDDPSETRKRRFCCVECAKAALEYKNRKTNHHYGATLREAQRLIAKDQAEPRPCKQCGTMFKADYSSAQFCSSRCHGIHQAGALAYSHEPRQCEVCDTTFTPTSRKQSCCSQSCARTLNLRKEAEKLAGERRQCPHCQNEFQPLVKSQKYCGKECQTLANRANLGPLWNEKAKAERAAKRPPRPCEWCGEVFTPKTTAGRYCSHRCTGDASRHARGWEPRDLTRRVFDRYLTVPINASRPAWLTPERFDELVAA